MSEAGVVRRLGAGIDYMPWIAAGQHCRGRRRHGHQVSAYLKTGSVALYSDALESIVNVVTAIAALIAIRISVRPADRHHQFGHHKAEYFSAVVEGALIIVAAIFILREAWETLQPAAHASSSPGLGLTLNGLATTINAAWSACPMSFGRKMRSPAMAADGLAPVHRRDHLGRRHHRTGARNADRMADPRSAAGGCRGGLHPLRWLASCAHSVSGLMDVAVTSEDSRRIRRIISSNAEGAIEAHDLRTRSAGRVTFIEFHLVVPGTMAVAEAHRICDRLEEAIGMEVPGAEVLIHVEPEGEARHRGIVVV